MGAMPTREQILEALKVVIDPELRRDIVELEMVRSIEIKDGGIVDVTVSLTTPGCPIKNHFETAVDSAVRGVAGVTHVNVGFDVLTDQQKAGLQRKLGRPGGLPEGALAQVSDILCVGSGKGGVGKSSLTVNLAVALAAEGRKVGVLDADVWGYSIPRMLGLGAERPKVSAERKILPLEAHGLKVMSIGFFLDEDEAVVWRGPMLHKALTQFLEDVAWGELDFLLIDLPPGTGDVSMTLAQLLPQAKFVIVTTPQAAAQKVARRAAEMADKVKLEIAGIIENMSGFTTPAGERYTIFGEGGGQLLADELDVPLLAKVPLTMPLRATSDAGTPLVAVDPDDPAAQAVRHAAQGIIAMTPVELPIMQPPAPPQAAAQKVARRAAEMADKVKLEIAGVIENMSGFSTPAGERYQIFGEGGGRLLADEIDVPLLAKVPLTMPLREMSDAGTPLVAVDPDDPAAQAVRHAAQGIIAMAPVELPIMQPPAPPQPVGMSLPMAG
jgi:ATP-binding protein involved in chromosome partitioning